MSSSATSMALTDRGDAFVRSCAGKNSGTIDFDDFSSLTDAVLKSLSADRSETFRRDRRSYGGYMTNWIIGHTNRFACADFAAFDFQLGLGKNMVSDIGFSFGNDQMDATAVERRE